MEGYVAVWKVMWLSGRLCGCLEGYVAVWRGYVAVWRGYVAVWRGYVAVWRGHVAVWRGNPRNLRSGEETPGICDLERNLRSGEETLGICDLERKPQESAIWRGNPRNLRSGEETPGICDLERNPRNRRNPRNPDLRTVPYRPLITTFHMANDRPSEGPILRRLCTPPHETVIFHVDFALHPEFRFWAQKCTLPHETVFFLKFGPPKSYFFAFSDRKFQNSPRISDAQTTDFRLEFGASKQVFCLGICDLERFWRVCQESVIWSDFGGFALGSVIWSDFGGFALGSVIWSDFGGSARNR
jgi:hypothetical protein